MKTHALIVSDRDMKELRQVVDALKQSGFKEQTQVEVLDQILQIAGAVAPGRFPKDVIRMESRFRILDVNSGKSEQYTLVFPDKADISQGRISILVPLGTAVLGYVAGDLVEANVPGRRKQVKQIGRRRISAGTKSVGARNNIWPVLDQHSFSQSCPDGQLNTKRIPAFVSEQNCSANCRRHRLAGGTLAPRRKRGRGAVHRSVRGPPARKRSFQVRPISPKAWLFFS
jgi:regulator of nucleoside diphosphate kinase